MFLCDSLNLPIPNSVFYLSKTENIFELGIIPKISLKYNTLKIPQCLAIKHRGQIPNHSGSDHGHIFFYFLYTHGSHPKLGQKYTNWIFDILKKGSKILILGFLCKTWKIDDYTSHKTYICPGSSVKRGGKLSEERR